jgi:hypothetical protein
VKFSDQNRSQRPTSIDAGAAANKSVASRHLRNEIERTIKTGAICIPERLRDARRAQPVYRFEFSAAMNGHS